MKKKFDQDLCLNLWYDPLGYYGKMNSTLGSVVPLAMFYFLFYKLEQNWIKLKLMKFWWFFRPRWLWPEVEWNVISSPQNGKGHMWSQSDIISDQNIYQIEKKIYDVCINIYLKLGDLGHMLVSVLKNSSDETYDNVNDDIQNWAVET